MPDSRLHYVLDRLPFGNNLRLGALDVDELVARSQADPWHGYAILNRRWRRHVCVPCRWFSRALPPTAAIFEPGCGSAANLLWLGQMGYRNLHGSDISQKALDLADELARRMGLSITTWQDDGLAPQHLPQNLDGILSVNWLYHIPGVDLGNFLTTYRPALKIGGLVAFDMVTRSYDRKPDNQYHSDDLELPAERRRPSEYTLRLDEDEVRRVARDQGFALVHASCFVLSRPQRAAYLLRRER